jgi:hypothetical protein
MARRIQIRRDTAANWTSNDPTLTQGELGLETDTSRVKVGDGTTAWTSLPYGINPKNIAIDVSNEFNEAGAKTTPVAADRFLIEDSEDSYSKKYVAVTNLPGGIDTTAIHKATPAEISAITEKASPIGADLILIEDSADSNNKKRIQISSLPTGSDADAIHDNVANEISAITEKTSLTSSDILIIEDSAAGFVKKKVAVSNLPGGVDVTAIHKATPSEIAVLSQVSGGLADGDQFIIEDASASYAKRRAEASDIADYVVGKIGLFSVTKNGDQGTNSTTYVDVVNWDTPNINTAGITVNSGAGTFTLVNAGTYEITYNLTNIQTGVSNNRNYADHQLVLDGTQIKGTYGITYNRNTTDPGSHVSCTVIITVTAGQVLKLQFRTDSATYTQTIPEESCAITIKRWS